MSVGVGMSVDVRMSVDVDVDVRREWNVSVREDARVCVDIFCGAVLVVIYAFRSAAFFVSIFFSQMPILICFSDPTVYVMPAFSFHIPHPSSLVPHPIARPWTTIFVTW